MSKIFDNGFFELTLDWFTGKSTFAHRLKNLASPVFNFLKGIAKDEDIVHINTNASRIQNDFEANIDHTLKRSRSIAKTKKHDQRFEKASIRDKCSFPLITLFDPNIVISPANVNDGEVFRCLSFRDLEDFG